MPCFRHELNNFSWRSCSCSLDLECSSISLRIRSSAFFCFSITSLPLSWFLKVWIHNSAPRQVEMLGMVYIICGKGHWKCLMIKILWITFNLKVSAFFLKVSWYAHVVNSTDPLPLDARGLTENILKRSSGKSVVCSSSMSFRDPFLALTEVTH